MPNRTATLAWAISATLLANGCLLLTSGDSAHAADNCLAAPNGTAPDGGHWYYRVDHATKRHCWYIKGETEKRSLGAPQDLSPAANAVAPPRKTTTPPALANARDELPLPLPRVEQSARPAPQPAPAPTAAPAIADQTGSIPDVNPQRPVPASPWPDPATPNPSTAASSAGPTPGPATNPPSNPVAAPPPPASIAATPAPAGSPSANQSISIPKILLVLAGALSVVSVMGGFGFGGKPSRGRREVRVNWPVNPHSVAVDRRRPPNYANAGGRVRDTRAADDPNRRIAEMMARLMRDAPSSS